MKIAIVGCGVVGGNLARALEEIGYKISRYDPIKKLFDDMSESKIVFICVPSDKVKEALSYVNQKNKKGLVVIRSTLKVGQTDGFLKLFKRDIVFMPEFLSRKTARMDTLCPDQFVFGSHSEEAVTILTELFSPFSKNVVAMKPAEAELAKLALNSLGLVKVIFANELFDIVNAYKVDYSKIHEVFANSKLYSIQHLNPLSDGYRGASGGCLPKNIRFLITAAETKGASSRLLKLVKAMNEELLVSGGFDGS